MHISLINRINEKVKSLIGDKIDTIFRGVLPTDASRHCKRLRFRTITLLFWLTTTPYSTEFSMVVKISKS